MKKQPFHNFIVDHMTLLVEPELYRTTYALFRIVFGVSKENLLYEKRSNWPGQKPASMTFASRLGIEKNGRVPAQTIVARDLIEGEQASRTVAPELLRDPLVAHLLKGGNIGVGAWPFVDPNIYGLEVNGLRTAHRAPNGLATRFLQ